jgi:hypothetical protein
MAFRLLSSLVRSTADIFDASPAERMRSAATARPALLLSQYPFHD